MIEGEKLPEISTEPMSGWEVFAIITLFVVSTVGFFVFVIRGISAVFKSASIGKKNRRRHRGQDNNNSFWSNNSSDWSSSDSSSSSSDFSGGGGDSSGGGASDSW